jgi:hypothetical protein
MRKLLKKYAMAPDPLVTDDSRSYGAAVRDPGIESRNELGKRVSRDGTPCQTRSNDHVSIRSEGEVSIGADTDSAAALLLGEITKL